ncbi:L-threonylcarbamoyladenylate synthase [Vaginisenegalia massiliensis]|uniref:L-threonylcarbamoyladenylate synthase n=1 Tax=Vaginisenegalia massiliensis TaxID=2058294 RepID=UPI000F537DDD|nr:L-threonylcarbamoyladenylate synthase [Vaginisenegalia massiliensis]
MKTHVFDYQTLKEAAAWVRSGELVAFPTETVFGLGAIANNQEAVAKVFEAKGRPSDNPLIVHVAKPKDVELVAESISPLAQALMERFWPGPLTIIFPLKANILPSNVTGGKNSVAVRMPKSLETLLMIEMVGFPMVGPSANRSGKPSPTLIEHVIHDFDGQIAGVIQPSKPVEIGVESTVVLPQEDRILILRPGAITQSMLASLGYPVEEVSAREQLARPEVLSPGVKYRHYSPKQPVYMIPANASISQWHIFVNKFEHVAILADQAILQTLSSANLVAHYNLGPVGDIAAATANLFAGLRALEASEASVILVQTFDDLENEAAHAYMNRLSKAAESML